MSIGIDYMAQKLCSTQKVEEEEEENGDSCCWIKKRTIALMVC